jgi:hypothetical protein
VVVVVVRRLWALVAVALSVGRAAAVLLLPLQGRRLLVLAAVAVAVRPLALPGLLVEALAAAAL